MRITFRRSCPERSKAFDFLRDTSNELSDIELEGRTRRTKVAEDRLSGRPVIGGQHVS